MAERLELSAWAKPRSWACFTGRPRQGRAPERVASTASKPVRQPATWLSGSCASALAGVLGSRRLLGVLGDPRPYPLPFPLIHTSHTTLPPISPTPDPSPIAHCPHAAATPPPSQLLARASAADRAARRGSRSDDATARSEMFRFAARSPLRAAAALPLNRAPAHWECGRVTVPLLAATRAHAHRFWLPPAPPLSVSAFSDRRASASKEKPYSAQSPQVRSDLRLQSAAISWPCPPCFLPTPSSICRASARQHMPFQAVKRTAQTSITPYRKLSCGGGCGRAARYKRPRGRWQQRAILSLGLQQIYLAKGASASLPASAARVNLWSIGLRGSDCLFRWITSGTRTVHVTL